MRYVLALAAALIGGMLAGETGLFLGGLIGLVFVTWGQRGDLLALEAKVTALTGRIAANDGAPLTQAAPSAPPAANTTGETPASPSAVPDEPAKEATATPWPTAPRSQPHEPNAAERAIARLVDAVKRFFTTGNVVVRVGVVVLFFGVAFLLRYAYENALLPIELRLGGSALGGIVLAATGWRLRHRVDTYGVVLQGAGIGVLYLTIFAAARLYDLLPLSAAFAMLVVLVAASCVLAVVQNSQALAIFAMSGGFLAPVLTSTGAGSHVALFSYYALLNAGIFVMAWFRYWRWLNWVGFLFTFVIGALWGRQYYRPELFSTTEPFLLLFFFYYVGVCVLFARRRGLDLRGIVDGTLVFGTPIVAFALQAALVADKPFGLAFSALCVALVYTALALWLRSQGAFALLLTPSFTALGVAFATLAIPFAFDDQRFTAATWALEGAGLVWVGLRQQQWLPRVAGMLLQVGAGAMFLAQIGSSVGPRLVLNSAYLGALMLALAGGFTAFQLSRLAPGTNRWERPLRGWYLGWAVVWWYAGGVREIGRFQPPWHEPFVQHDVHEHLFTLFASATTAALVLLARRFHWRDALTPGFLLLPVLVSVALLLAVDGYQAHPLVDLGWLVWPVGLSALLFHLHDADVFTRTAAVWHAVTWWFASLLIAWIAAYTVQETIATNVWSDVLWGTVPLLAIVALLRVQRKGLTPLLNARWPFSTHTGAYFGWGFGVMVGYLLLWVLMIGATPGDPDPLPYVPVANPIDLTSLAVLMVTFVWTRSLVASGLASTANLIRGVAGIAGFLWLNLAAARAVHFYGGVPYPIDFVFASDAFQTTATILWTLVALVLMASGTRRQLRLSWIVGASLLALVIVKLFAVDLGNLDVVARIVSFITVGVLMLVIGYFAPLPPRRPVEANV